jgi:predicted KAP-like P-loop ATPase
MIKNLKQPMNLNAMSDRNAFNDAPILTPEDDLFSIEAFTQALANRFREISSPVGATIALNGAWGSGKSSAVNLILIT